MPKNAWWDGTQKEYELQLRRLRTLLHHCSNEEEGLFIEEALRILERAYRTKKKDTILAAIFYARDRFG
jgi:hypothetical protein